MDDLTKYRIVLGLATALHAIIFLWLILGFRKLSPLKAKIIAMFLAASALAAFLVMTFMPR